MSFSLYQKNNGCFSETNSRVVIDANDVCTHREKNTKQIQLSKHARFADHIPCGRNTALTSYVIAAPCAQGREQEMVS
jgi:hypothetical protein